MPDLLQFKNRFSFAGGIFVSFDLGPLAIQPEVLYAPYGTKLIFILMTSYRARYSLIIWKGFSF
jgi:hypothetical protein